MANTVEIGNPVSGGSRYTSAKKAFEHVSRGRAFLCDEGKLWFVDRNEKTERRLLDPVCNVVSWNGSPKPALLRAVKITGMILMGGIPERVPGEVRS